MTAADLLRLEDLQISFFPADGEVPAVKGVTFGIAPGEAVGIVGESGCGKSAAALSVVGLLPSSGQVVGGRILFEGRDVVPLSQRQLRGMRGRDVGMVFQDPMTSLDPVFTVGHQLGEALAAHQDLTRSEVAARSAALLREVGIPEPEARLSAYPFQLSGGLRQRVMIAIAVACRPRLLIADEPTTALDVTIAAQIMALLGGLRRERGMSLLLITHDLGLVAHSVERVIVMYAGRLVEEASTAELFAHPLHPYTQGLLGSLPGSGRVLRGEKLRAIPGNVPHPARVPSGCSFRDRCSTAVDACGDALPLWEEKAPGHRVRCLRVERRV